MVNVPDDYLQDKYNSLKKIIDERTKMIERCKNDIILATGQIQLLEALKPFTETKKEKEEAMKRQGPIIPEE